MQKKPTVSIIVPVYNAEKYLRRCVDSILKQEFQDFELILVNDGSRDSSGAICREYADRDARVRLIDKENTGVSDSRNRALDFASGEFVQFLDSDDWMTPESTKLLVQTAREDKCDLVIADFYRVVGNRVSQKGDIDDDQVMTRREFAAHMMENPADFYYGVLWNKLFRREIIENVHLRMDPQINWCEDFLFNMEYIRHAKVFRAIQTPIYYYVKTEGSLVSQGMSLNKTVKMKLNVFEYYNEFYKDIYDDEDYDSIRLQLYGFFFTGAKDSVVLPAILPGSCRLGRERVYVNQDALQAESLVMEEYRARKLVQHYCESVGAKYNLTPVEVMTIAYLDRIEDVRDMSELAEYMETPRLAVVTGLQKLMRRNYISKKTKDHLELTPEADAILEDLRKAEQEYEEIRFRNFSEEEKEICRRLKRREWENVEKIFSTI